VLPHFTQIFQGWRPLQEPGRGVGDLLTWRDLLEDSAKRDAIFQVGLLSAFAEVFRSHVLCWDAFSQHRLDPGRVSNQHWLLHWELKHKPPVCSNGGLSTFHSCSQPFSSKVSLTKQLKPCSLTSSPSLLGSILPPYLQFYALLLLHSAVYQFLFL
jgi:hypothetical protein